MVPKVSILSLCITIVAVHASEHPHRNQTPHKRHCKTVDGYTQQHGARWYTDACRNYCDCTDGNIVCSQKYCKYPQGRGHAGKAHGAQGGPRVQIKQSSYHVQSGSSYNHTPPPKVWNHGSGSSYRYGTGFSYSTGGPRQYGSYGRGDGLGHSGDLGFRVDGFGGLGGGLGRGGFGNSNGGYESPNHGSGYDGGHIGHGAGLGAGHGAPGSDQGYANPNDVPLPDPNAGYIDTFPETEGGTWY